MCWHLSTIQRNQVEVSAEAANGYASTFTAITIDSFICVCTEIVPLSLKQVCWKTIIAKCIKKIKCSRKCWCRYSFFSCSCHYVTPTSYLELINSFKRLLKLKRTEVKTLKDRYTNGYNTLIETENKVGTMREQLEALGQPPLCE